MTSFMSKKFNKHVNIILAKKYNNNWLKFSYKNFILKIRIKIDILFDKLFFSLHFHKNKMAIFNS